MFTVHCARRESDREINRFVDHKALYMLQRCMKYEKTKGSLIRTGGYGAVYNIQEDDDVVLKCTKTDGSVYVKKSGVNEIFISMLLPKHHPHIVKMLGYICNQPCLLMEKIAPIIDLNTLSRPEVALIHKQLFKTIFELSKKYGFNHNDLKPGNVLVTKTDRGQLSIKLIDFGLSSMNYGAHKRIAAGFKPFHIDPYVIEPYSDVFLWLFQSYRHRYGSVWSTFIRDLFNLIRVDPSHEIEDYVPRSSLREINYGYLARCSYPHDSDLLDSLLLPFLNNEASKLGSNTVANS